MIPVENTVQQTPNVIWLKQEIIPVENTVQQTPDFLWLKQEIIPVGNTGKTNSKLYLV